MEFCVFLDILVAVIVCRWFGSLFGLFVVWSYLLVGLWWMLAIDAAAVLIEVCLVSEGVLVVEGCIV